MTISKRQVRSSPPRIDYPLRLFFDCSTAHLSATTHRWLDERSVAPEKRQLASINAPAATPFGWFVFAAEPPFHDEEPPDLIALMRYARTLGAEYILFDADAPENASLPLASPIGLSGASGGPR